MFGGGGSTPPPPKPPPVPPPAPTPADTSVVEAGQKVRSASKAGVGATIATGSGGLTTPANTGSKSLLGD
jgi:hypothetical protein